MLTYEVNCSDKFREAFLLQLNQTHCGIFVSFLVFSCSEERRKAYFINLWKLVLLFLNEYHIFNIFNQLCCRLFIFILLFVFLLFEHFLYEPICKKKAFQCNAKLLSH